MEVTVQHARLTPIAPWIPTGLIVATVGLALLLLAGCTLVADRLTGVGLTKGNPTTCIKECNNLYRLLFDEEHKRHLQNVENCLGLPQPDKDACLLAEEARHSAEMSRLGQAKRDCHDGCHHQGGGNAG
jgi:hypothetical protein